MWEGVKCQGFSHKGLSTSGMLMQGTAVLVSPCNLNLGSPLDPCGHFKSQIVTSLESPRRFWDRVVLGGMVGTQIEQEWVVHCVALNTQLSREPWLFLKFSWGEETYFRSYVKIPQ